MNQRRACKILRQIAGVNFHQPVCAKRNCAAIQSTFKLCSFFDAPKEQPKSDFVESLSISGLCPYNDGEIDTSSQ